MKRMLFTLVVGLVGGFAIGAYSPVTDYLQLDTVTGLLKSGDSATETAEAEDAKSSSPIAKLRTAVEVITDAGSEPVGALSSIGEAVAKVKSGGWVMAHEDVSQSEDPIAQAALQADGGEATLSAEDQQFIDALKAAQVYMADENKDFDARIAAMKPDHPEYFFVQALRESNIAMTGYLQHLIDLQTEPITIESLAALQSALDESEKKINAFSKDGLEVNASWASVAKIIPAKTEQDRAMKMTMSQLFATYDQSFAVENSLAAKLGEYPSLVAIEVASGGDGSSIGIWANQLEALVDSRLAIQEQRQKFATDMLSLVPSS